METTHQPIQHRGSCHCGAVRFEVTVDATRGSRCNCTACMKISGTTAIVKPDALVLLQGEADLGEYAWGGRTGTRYFCKRCGVHVFLRGHLVQLGGDYVSVSLNCLDDVDLRDVEVGYWDGRNNNWMAGMRPAPWPVTPST